MKRITPYHSAIASLRQDIDYWNRVRGQTNVDSKDVDSKVTKLNHRILDMQKCIIAESK